MADAPESDDAGTGAVVPAPHPPADTALPPVPTTEPDTGYTADGVPTLEGVREKIETRYGTALGATELGEETPEGRSAAERYDTMQKAAAEKLDEIRASMHEASMHEASMHEAPMHEEG